MILLLEDKLGISEGYRYIWDEILLSSGFTEHDIARRSVWRSPIARSHLLLTRKGNRKAPGFNPDPNVQVLIRRFVDGMVNQIKPNAIVCMDPAVLFLVEPDWSIATIDLMRGGVYSYLNIPFVVTVPISAVNSKKRPKDIRAMNEGAESKEEWEEDEHDAEEFFVEPYTIPFGKWILNADMRKVHRVML